MNPATQAAAYTDLDRQSVDTIRFLAVDAVEKANSGHPGMPMGAAPMAYVLWTRHLRHNPANPNWVDRDRFILSAGHGSMLLYALLHLTGYDLPMDELKAFRQWGSATPGHPEYGHTLGVETTTGPLGQGFATGVGMAIAERYLAAHFNTEAHSVVDHYTYAIVSDGDLQEGVAAEAASLAGHLGLGKMIYLYDDNSISIDGNTDLSFTESVPDRFRAYGWQVLTVTDGNDLEAIDEAIRSAKEVTDKPTLIAVKTNIGYGSPNKQDTSSAHGSPLGTDEVALTKQRLGWPEEPTFHVPEAVYEHMDGTARGAAHENAWTNTYEAFAAADPTQGTRFRRWMAGELPEDWDGDVPVFESGGAMATRASSGKVLNALAGRVDNLIGGSADLTGSNKTEIKGREGFQKQNPSGGYLYFGVREHAMAAACNGMALHGGLRPFCGTFLIFSDYMRASVRLSALMGMPVTYVFTHDSVGLGEDGPTHQPVEHYMALRAIPNLTFLRPADANETAYAWRVALETTDRPVALSLTRQNLPNLDQTRYGSAAGVRRGAYILRDSEGTPDVILMASGSEVAIILEAADQLASDGVAVRVVSMPSWELFEAQDAEYRASVLPPDVRRRVSLEAGITLGWQRYVGLDGVALGVDRFGASAPYEEIYDHFGLTATRVVEAATGLLT